MTREEALNEIKSWAIPSEKGREVLKTLIPELAESEDERIGNVIYCIVRDNKEVKRILEGNGVSVDNALAYLEKQKYDRMQPIYDNQESFESALNKAWKSYNDSGARTVDGCEDNYTECAHAKGFREGYLFGLEKQKDLDKMIVVSPEVWDNAISDAYENGKKDGEKQKEQTWMPTEGEMGVLYKLCYISNQITDEDDTELTRLYQDLKREYFNGHSFENMFPLEKQKERGPLTKEEEYILHRIIEYLEDETCPSEWISLLHDIYCLPYEKQKEQKPAWSEGFEQNIKNLLHDKLTWHSDDGSMSSAVFIDDKTIKDIVTGIWFYVGKEMMKNPNMELPEQEWSEQDKRKLQKCIEVVERWERDLDIAYAPYSSILKSLRPSWKPSEDQMNALYNVINPCDHVDKKALESLYKQLEKLI